MSDETAQPKTSRSRLVTVGGWLGMALLLVGFALRIGERIEDDAPLYVALNIIGAALVGVQCVVQRAWPQLTVELGWIAITLITLWSAS